MGGLVVLLYISLKKENGNKLRKEMVILWSDLALCAEMNGRQGKRNEKSEGIVINSIQIKRKLLNNLFNF